jgi:sugar porter (SP) family MFS transporter
MTNGMQVLTQWLDQFGNPTGATLGLFGAANAIGGVFPFLFLGWLGDKFGRRLPTAIGSVIIIAGALIELFATSLAMYIGGKIVLGVGSSMIQMGAPVLVSELSHPKERVRITTFYNTSVVLGYVIGAWGTFGCAKINGSWAWKLPTLIQVLPSAYQFTLIWFCPESPRWLVAQGRVDEARNILVKYHGEGQQDSALVQSELEEIENAIIAERENNPTWGEFIKSPGNLKRLWICLCVSVFGQTSGNALISSYLTQILKDTGIESEADITLVNGMVTLWQYIVCLTVCFLVDRLRRRTFFLVGSGGVAVVFIAWTIAAQQYLEKDSLTGGRIVLACIFLFQAFYTFAWTNVSVTYMMEVTTYQMRAKTWSLSLLVVQCATIYSSYVNPIGLENIGWKFYIYYDIWVSITFLIIYFTFVETSNWTLEELTFLFEGDQTDNIVRETKKVSLVEELSIAHLEDL